MRELRYLTAFSTLAQERHFGRAAQRLGMTQPSLSEQIVRLEAALGVQLVVRTTRPVGLTVAGRELADAITGPLRTIQASVERLRVHDPDRILRLALPRAQFRRHPPIRALMERLRSQLPGWEIAVSELLGSGATEGLRDGVIDVAIAYSPIYGNDLQIEPLFMDMPVLLMPAGHALTSGPEVSLSALDAIPLLTWRSDATPGLMDAFFAACERHDVHPQVVEIDPAPGALARSLAAGVGVAVVARAWADNALLGAGFAIRPLRQPSFALSGVVVWSTTGRPAVLAALASSLDGHPAS